MFSEETLVHPQKLITGSIRHGGSFSASALTICLPEEGVCTAPCTQAAGVWSLLSSHC